jgi:hypothetical protein
MSTRWSPDFLDLLTALNAADARYMLVGGHAVGLFGRPRATKDFDPWIEASPDDASRVLGALRDFGAPLAGLTEADLAQPGNGSGWASRWASAGARGCGHPRAAGPAQGAVTTAARAENLSVSRPT